MNYLKYIPSYGSLSQGTRTTLTNGTKVILLFVFMGLTNCITPFIPEITEQKKLLVVQGLITDQEETYTIKLSESLPFGQSTKTIPVEGCSVSVSDDLGNYFNFHESQPGIYTSDSLAFRGETGRTYTMHVIRTNGTGNTHYESYPVEMKPVPAVDSLYYEKVRIKDSVGYFPGAEGCQVYLDTHDPTKSCMYYRWDFTETWKIRLNFDIPNHICWITNPSYAIYIKNTSALDEDRITRYPVHFISNLTDRLSLRYSILVNQYSMTSDEYTYWQSVQNLTSLTGGLSDIIPSSIQGNIYCTDNPAETVLGYFSVSAKKSKRIYIQDKFEGVVNPYADCVTDTVYSVNPADLNVSVWILLTHKCAMPCATSFEITTHQECTDCTLRGTNIKPSFWTDDK
ncbi:MAG TPA: DUF4249 domain-containing protein [Bacteroidales bacterium]|nr:DUF4249 domain-containing protein [Bacteroidales bacterium]